MELNTLFLLLNTRLSDLAAASLSLRQITPVSLALRLGLALLFGGIIGLERGRKHRPAGFRTYMLVCMGATMTMLLGQYMVTLNETSDVARFGAQVINGIGFLGAGTILVTRKQQVKGLTTAAGLWASACMGLVLGAGFYECACLSFLLIFLAILLLPKIEAFLVEKSRNMNIYISFPSMDQVYEIIACLKSLDLRIYEIDLDRGDGTQGGSPNGVFSVRLPKKQSHAKVIAALSGLDAIRTIEEI